MLVIGAMLPLAFYTQAEREGGTLQYTLVGLSVTLFLVMLYLSRKSQLKAKSRGTSHLEFISVATLTMGMASFLMADVVPLEFARVWGRILIFLFVACTVSSYLLRIANWEAVTLSAGLTAAIAMVVAFLSVVILAGIEVADARHRIVPMSALFMACFYIPRLRETDLGAWAKRAFVVSLFVLILFSQTRSYLLAFVAALVVHRLIELKNKGIRSLFGSGMVLMAFPLIVLSLQGTETYTRWVGRLSGGSGRDPTTLTRLGEYSDQMAQLTQSLRSLLIGVGPGARYTWDAAYVNELIATGVIRIDDGVNYYLFGHSLWVYSMFSMGLLGGLLIPTLVVGAFIRSFSAATNERVHSETAQLYHSLATALTAVITVSFTAHPLGNWTNGMIVGVLIALAYVDHQAFDQLRARRKLEAYRMPGRPRGARKAIAYPGPLTSSRSSTA